MPVQLWPSPPANPASMSCSSGRCSNRNLPPYTCVRAPIRANSSAKFHSLQNRESQGGEKEPENVWRSQSADVRSAQQGGPVLLEQNHHKPGDDQRRAGQLER